ncbi:MAG: thioredoxin [Chitinivibrionales bacterium]
MAYRKRVGLTITAAVITAFVLIAGCGKKAQTGDEPGAKGKTQEVVKTITSTEEFEKIVLQKDRLLVFDLYADWCMPCRILSPMLEKLAQEAGEKAQFYKINVDEYPSLAQAFGVRGIPYVVFVKNQKAVHALTGVRPKEDYLRIVDNFAGSSQEYKPNGKLVDGVRMIEMNVGGASENLGDIYVYRGDTVSLTFKDAPFEHSVSIPEWDIITQADSGQQLTIGFKAAKTGIYPIYCNGNCPAGDGAMVGKIVVMDYENSEHAKFVNVDPAKAQEMIENGDVLVLDVRTPREFYSGHIKGATLIPISQLQGRLREIGKHKQKDVLIYCRSGNRSTVAGQILNADGFEKIYHLQGGVKSWMKADKPLVTDKR